MPFTNPWGPHTSKIILQCSLITIPMLASTMALLWIVFSNKIEETCPYSELCPGPDVMNTTLKSNYYVDYPVARLAFISSWSSTVSLALVGFMMSIYAFTSAADLIRLSQDSTRQQALPSPHQMSLLLRTLNSESLILWSLATSVVKRLFSEKFKNDSCSQKSSRIVQTSVAFFVVGITASLLIQGADVYFHVAAEAIELAQIHVLSSTSHHYSKGLAPWCLNRPALGSMGYKSFWGCSISGQLATNGPRLNLFVTNNTAIFDLMNSKSKDYQIFNFTDSNDLQYALVGPGGVDTAMDWKATSFGVSTSCSAIPEDACAVKNSTMKEIDDGPNQVVTLKPFRCTLDRAGIDVSGNITPSVTGVHTMNFHKYLRESTPFYDQTLAALPNLSTTMEGTLSEDPSDIFKNPWSTLIMRNVFGIQGDIFGLPPSFRNDKRVWGQENSAGSHVLLHCNVTVWDVMYTAIGSKVTSLTSTPSNGSIAGISSMYGLRSLNSLASKMQALSRGTEARTSVDTLVRSLELELSRVYTYPLAAQLSNRPSLLAQQRVSKVITKLPAAALWLLVVANLLFALLGFSLAVSAILRTTPDVHQVQMRLGVTGLAAALFDKIQSERSADTDDNLFEENWKKMPTNIKRVGVEKTDTGGSAFKLYH
ncbi:hypothetical protein BDV95DRAFT_666115 [Massariosphaeria phaeospora]|uniref:Uncharacterized protein n=1 Tax=Massariosphaeria phaeospora TaxID=100035 RepID=A0A7C8I9P3_9PLEO|nr:hypothetical protein BDV95DRAFT_666115 [Massariosphaeria phaeospora]